LLSQRSGKEPAVIGIIGLIPIELKVCGGLHQVDFARSIERGHEK
jgi:hypothetical protein